MPKTNINDHICTIWLLFKIVTVAGRDDKGDNKKHGNRKPLNIH